MAGKQRYWYSIVSYVQDIIRNETLNVGIILTKESSNEIRFKLLPKSNKKISGTSITKYEQKLYKTNIDLLEYLLNSIDSNNLQLPLQDNSKGSILNLLNPDLIPSNLLISDPQPFRTQNIDLMFDKILDTYVGNRYFNDSIPNVVETKEIARQLFAKNNILGNKIKQNIKIQPVKNIPIKFNIDFAYSEKNKINLIHSAPHNANSLDDWFLRMNTISTRYENPGKIMLLSDLSASVNSDNALDQMISELTAKDTRISNYDISNKTSLLHLNNFAKTIQSEADDGDQVDKILSIENIKNNIA